MKKFVFLLIGFLLIGCTSEYCCLKKPVQELDAIFMTQIRRGFKDTKQNFYSIADYVSNDFKTSEKRLKDSFALAYSKNDFAGTPKRMKYYTDLLSKQFNNGVEDTKNNLKIIAKYMCLYDEN